MHPNFAILTPGGRFTKLRYLFVSIIAWAIITLGYSFHVSDTILLIIKYSIILLGAYIAIIAVTKRLRDIDISFLWGILMFIPGVNIFFFFYLLIATSKQGKNRYGEEGF